MGCCGGKNPEPPGMPDTLENWTILFDCIHERMKSGSRPLSPLYLVNLLEVAEFLSKEHNDSERAYMLLENALVDFHKAKEIEDQREEDEKQKRRQTLAKTGVKKMNREAGDSEEDEIIKKKQKSRTLKVVVRFLQRRLQMWNSDLKKGKIESIALKEREKYAVVDGDQKKDDDDDSDAEEEEKGGDPFTKGWVPAPKASLDLDRLDIFLAGDYDFPAFDAGDPVGLFFKLRYGVRLSEQKNFEKAIETVEKAYKLAAEVAAEQKQADDKAAEEELKKNLKKKEKPKPKKSITGKQLIPRDPKQDLPDVLSMSTRKLYLWRLEHNK